jgi:hypothetical protein
MTTYTAYTRADLVGYMTGGGSANGDTILLGSSGGPIDGSGLTLIANREYHAADGFGALDPDPLGDGISTWAPRFTRTAVLHGPVRPPVGNPGDWVTMSGIKIQLKPGLWPDDGSVADAWLAPMQALFPDLTSTTYVLQSVFGQWGANTELELILDRMEICAGYGDAVTPFDPDFDYPEWAETGKRMLNGPGLMLTRHSKIRMTNSYLHDAMGSRGILTWSAGTSGGVMEVDSCWLERTCGDFIQMAAKGVGPNTKYKVTRCLGLDAISDPDPNNDGNTGDAPHTDFFQPPILEGSGPVNGIEADNNFVGFTVANPINATQGIFLVAAAANAPANKAWYRGVRVRNFINMLSNKTVYMDSCEGADIQRVIGVNPDYIANAQGSLPANFNFFKQGTGVGSAPPGLARVRDSIAENAISAAGMGLRQVNNKVLAGVGKNGAAQTATFVKGAGVPDTPHEMWQWVQRLSGDASKGPQHASLHAFLTDPLDFTGEVPFVELPPLSNVPKATLIRAMCFVFAGDDGDTIAFTPPPGVSWRLYERDVKLGSETGTGTETLGNPRGTLSGTPVSGSAWSSSAGSLISGKMLVVEYTTVNTDGALQALNYTAGGQSFTWSVANASLQKLPRATLAAFTGWQKTGKMQVGGQDIAAECGTILIAKRFNDVSGVGRQYCDNGGTLGGPDISGFGPAIACGFQNAAGAVVASANVGTAGVFQVTRDYLVGFAFDMRPDENGVRPASYADAGYYGVSDNGAAMLKRASPTSTAWNTANLPVNWSNTTPTLLKRYANNDQTPSCDIMLIAATPEFVALAQYESILTCYSVELWGPAGEGLSPTETPWPLWFVGRADRMDAGTANFGTGGAFTKVNSATVADQTPDMPWPPKLVLSSALAPGATVRVGQPVLIDVFCNGYNDAHTLTMSVSGAGAAGGSFDGGAVQAVAKGAQDPLRGRKITRAFTPAATGPLLIDFSSDHPSGYTAPAQLALTVLPAVVPPNVMPRPRGMTSPGRIGRF